ncbi:MAG: TRAP transporter substrate-binding protein DctP [Spirochaetaceae bacterium]|jgi:TRAP-type C4-dicarboxylate transport system substrate-binding protein|nr:TRAP transporter substrate-binding protein DctP [Spirochaetaceae bacterium]
MRRFLLFIVFCFAAGTGFAAPVEVRLASIAPENSAWGKALNQMAVEWKAATGGQVILRVWHNGVLGGEEAVILQKLRTNQIQAAVFTSSGMSNISKKLFTLSAPFLIRNDDEMNYVLENVGGSLEEEIERSGFQLVAWSRIGWIRFFSRYPVSVPADLKRQKLSGSSDTPELSNMFKTMGYTVVTTSFSDLLVALNSGTIDAIYQIPPFVASMQLFGIIKNMMPLDIAPVMGGIVINQATWRRIPERYRAKILEISRRIASENDDGARQLSADSVSIMQRYGLVSTPLTKAQEQLWIDEASTAIPAMMNDRNSALDAGIYRSIQNLLSAYRKR